MKNKSMLAQNAQAELSLRDIVKTFGKIKAVDKVSLDFFKGELCVILGPSGCGKTTLLNIIAGLAQPTSGRVIYGGEDISSLPPEQRGFGMVFQNYALFPNLTAAENIAYGLHGKMSAPKRRERTAEILDIIKMHTRRDSYPAQLSGGQQQRVALGRALAPSPHLLLLDEPLSALDAQVRAELAQELLGIQRLAGISTIMVTHDQNEAMSLADRIVLMKDGAVEQSGPPLDIYRNPATLFAAEFFGHTNIISMPEILDGQNFGIRYEDVQVMEPLEQTLAGPDVYVGRIERRVLMGSFSRLNLLLNDFKTRLYADVPHVNPLSMCDPKTMVAVRLPSEHRLCW